jgi:hypothetical protein
MRRRRVAIASLRSSLRGCLRQAISLRSVAAKPTPQNYGVGTSDSPKPKTHSAPPKATSNCDRSITKKTESVEAHIVVCFLALAMWRVLEQWMRGKGLGMCARKLIAEMSTIKSMDIVLPVRRGETQTELTIRTVARPDRHVAELLIHLDLELRTRNRILAVPPPNTPAGVGQM